MSFLVVTCIVVALSSAFPLSARAADSEKKIRLLILVEASEPLAVDYRTKGRRARGAIAAGTLGILPILIESKIASGERAKESQRLQETVGEFDRRFVIEQAIAASFRAATPYFEAVTPKDPSSYFPGRREIAFDKASADGYPYILVVRERFAGMITAWEMNTLSASSYLRYELYDAANKKQLGKGDATAFGLQKHQLDPATSDPSIFMREYPAAVGAACGRIYGQLNKEGHLHAMAKVHGLGREVPDIGAVLEEYASRFDYKFKLPKGWKQVKGASKYSVSLEPNNADRMKFGVSFSVDLLIEEFGQNVNDLDEYIGIFFGRLRNLGYGVDAAESFEGLGLTVPHVAFLVNRPNGAGKEAILFRRLDDRCVAVYSIVFLEDFDGFMNKYRPDLESLINTAEITTRR